MGIYRSKIIVASHINHLAEKGAEIFHGAALDSTMRQSCFAVALSGGSSPRLMYRTLSKEPYLSGIPWQKIHIFWVDERCVPVSNTASNYSAVKKDLLNTVPIPLNHIHPMPGEAPPEKGALQYQHELMNFFQLENGQFPVFDLIFLGMGADGHTASLFPGHEVLEEKEQMIVTVKGGDPYVNRLTMTFPVLNHARNVVFLVSGREKAETVKTIFEKKHAVLPAGRVKPEKGELIWLLDSEAASLLAESH
ncbi:MAG: 6-phosphogluconolactonase [Thermodesulfobacteriota bacterium]|nr:6-phosphogluconolactonase [Thermodesulfobacteriota bacterium]